LAKRIKATIPTASNGSNRRKFRLTIDGVGEVEGMWSTQERWWEGKVHLFKAAPGLT
jgi:hypothetical protein